MKRFLNSSLVVMICLGIMAFSSMLMAEEKTDKAEKAKVLPKVAVKLLVGKGVSDDTAASLTEILCTQIMTHQKYQVLCASDVKAILVATQQTALIGNCDDNACYEALGKALNTPYLIVGTVGKVGKVYTISLSLISTETKTAKNRVSHEVTGNESKLIEGIKLAADKLVGK